jgi:hypothetical protein
MQQCSQPLKRLLLCQLLRLPSQRHQLQWNQRRRQHQASKSRHLNSLSHRYWIS